MPFQKSKGYLVFLICLFHQPWRVNNGVDVASITVYIWSFGFPFSVKDHGITTEASGHRPNLLCALVFFIGLNLVEAAGEWFSQTKDTAFVFHQLINLLLPVINYCQSCPLTVPINGCKFESAILRHVKDNIWKTYPWSVSGSCSGSCPFLAVHPICRTSGWGTFWWSSPPDCAITLGSRREDTKVSKIVLDLMGY